MPRIVVSTTESLHVDDSTELGGEELEEVVNEDIKQFEKWFCENVDTKAVRLTGPERAIIKTYLWYKTHSGEVPSGEAAGS